MANLYGMPMPQGAPMPQGSNMNPYGGAPRPPTPMAPTPQAPMPAAAPAMSSGAMGGVPATYSPPQPAPMGIGQNGFGIHHEATHNDMVDYLLPRFKSVESSHDYTNYIGKRENKPQDPQKTASGGYGFTNGTWNNYAGYPRAMDAPPEVQDAKMKEDLGGALQRYQGDIFKAVAHHYYPKFASNPTQWNQPLVNKHGKPIQDSQTVEEYLKSVLPPERVDRYLAGIRNINGSGGENRAPL